MTRLKASLVAASTILMLFSACSTKQNSNNESSTFGSSYFSEKITLKYLRGFTIRYHGSYAAVDVRDPFDSTKLLKRYILVDRSKPTPSGLPKGVVVKVPVEKSACFYGITVNEMARLGVNQTITGVAEPQYVKDSLVQAKLRQGKVVNIGEVAQANVERIIEANPEILVVSPISGGPLNKVEQTGVPLVYDCSYLENSPLARAEWIKFVALFFKKEALANKMFDSVDARYCRVSKIAKAAHSHRPTVFAEKKFGQVWYTPGGCSYMARFFADAGADYIWKDDRSTGSLSLSFETVLAKASEADYWIIKTNTPYVYTYSYLEKEFGLYTSFKAFKNASIVGCDTGRTPYYEDGFLEPDIVLSDLVSIFHPESLPGYIPKYYKMLAR
jgi:iron complex transport system substrate-binding protein